MKYQVTSFNESARGGGQITVVVGEGRNRRSFTRHLSPSMMGLNIDLRAPKLNAIYEDELRKAEANLTSAESTLKILKKRLEEVVETESSQVAIDNIVGDIVIAVVKTDLEAMIEAAEATVIAAVAVVDDAETKLFIVRRELPLMMKFYRN